MQAGMATVRRVAAGQAGGRNLKLELGCAEAEQLLERAPIKGLVEPLDQLDLRSVRPEFDLGRGGDRQQRDVVAPVSYTHLRAHETVLDLVCRLLLEKKKKQTNKINTYLLPKKPTNKTDNIQQNK